MTDDDDERWIWASQLVTLLALPEEVGLPMPASYFRAQNRFSNRFWDQYRPISRSSEMEQASDNLMEELRNLLARHKEIESSAAIAAAFRRSAIDILACAHVPPPLSQELERVAVDLAAGDDALQPSGISHEIKQVFERWSPFSL